MRMHSQRMHRRGNCLSCFWQQSTTPSWCMRQSMLIATDLSLIIWRHWPWCDGVAPQPCCVITTSSSSPFASGLLKDCCCQAHVKNAVACNVSLAGALLQQQQPLPLLQHGRAPGQQRRLQVSICRLRGAGR